MSDVPANGAVTPVEAELTPLPLSGQPATDRGYTLADGTRIRVRIVKGAEHTTQAPTNGKVALAPSGVSLLLSIALLDADDAVAKDDAGRLMITDKVELPITAEQLGNLAFDPQAEIERLVRIRAAAMQRALTARTALASYLDASWGGAPLVAGAATVVLPLLPALPVDAPAST